MNKKELIAQVQRNMGPGATRSTASAAVEAVLASIRLAAQQEKLHIAHFGTFEQVHRPARQGFDINTRAMRDIPEKTELTFRASSRLEDTVIGKAAGK